jgi:hypothetical protein
MLLAVPAIALAAAGTAVAVPSSSSGGSEIQILNRSDNVPSLTSSTTYSDVPGGTAVTTVPAGTSQLITARFAAESNCTRAVLPALGGRCSVRIVAQQVGGATVELSPQAGLDYAFDSVGTDGLEGHAMERSRRLGPGTYVIRAQRAVSNAATTFRLDDWHFAVEKNV